jgi:hypothetical protein
MNADKHRLNLVSQTLKAVTERELFFPRGNNFPSPSVFAPLRRDEWKKPRRSEAEAGGGEGWGEGEPHHQLHRHGQVRLGQFFEADVICS